MSKTTNWNCQWTTDRNTAFEDLKKHFTDFPVLLIPDDDKPFEIEADASLYATGAVLYQHDLNNPCAFLSQSLSSTERNYQIYNREFLSIICALCTWRHYIQESTFPTTIYNNHQNLTYFCTAQYLNPCQARWSLELGEYNIHLKYVPGSKMASADALS